MVFVALLFLAGYLMAHSGDGATAAIFAVVGVIVLLGVGRFLRLMAGIAMILRAFGA